MPRSSGCASRNGKRGGWELEVTKGRELGEDAKTCSLDQLLPGDFRRALGDKLELQSYQERLLF
eukprot:13317957-Alexandrium_andersonii.AAC.1